MILIEQFMFHGSLKVDYTHIKKKKLLNYNRIKKNDMITQYRLKKI